MDSFLNDFRYFLNFLLEYIQRFYLEFVNTIIGKIMLFIILISLFIYFIYKIIEMRN